LSKSLSRSLRILPKNAECCHAWACRAHGFRLSAHKIQTHFFSNLISFPTSYSLEQKY
jgi:hypothetical protein